MKYIIFFMFLLAGTAAFSQQTYIREWFKVDSLSNIGQPRTALEIVDKIQKETRLEKNATQFLKATIYRLALLSSFEEEYLVKAIKEAETEVAAAEEPVRQILHSMIAELYWQFYQNNRYRIMNQSVMSGYSPEDLRTWDLKMIVQVCIQHHKSSLENHELLKSVGINQYDAVLLPHHESRKYRPTLYDFLAFRALDFFINSEAGITQPASRFIIDNERYFHPTGPFSKLDIQSSDTLSFEFHAVKLMQDILGFHLPDAIPDALVDAELRRLSFVYDHCILPEKDSLLISSLKELESRYAGFPCSSEISYKIAMQLQVTARKYQPLISDVHKWDLKQADEIAGRAAERHAGSFGADNCKSFRQQLRFPSLEITTEYGNIPAKPFLVSVGYKNVDKLYFRIIRTDPSDDKEIMEAYHDERFKRYAGMKPDYSWEQALPDDGDFQTHRLEAKIPALPQGYYVMLASPSKHFEIDTLISLNRFWVTGISYISRRNDDGSYDVFVLGRQEGEPLKKVKVESFFREYDYSSRNYTDKPGGIFYTNQNGYVKIPARTGERYNQYYLVITGENDQFITEQYFSGYGYDPGPPRPVISTYFFTDRSIYRPGQTIYYKGIVIEKLDGKSSIKTGYKTSITFYDANGQKVASQDLVSNDFGSFSGTFTAPQGTLTGSMLIQCNTGSISLRVEEYKRPKFEITFNPVTGSYKLGETVTLTGKALAFAGNPVTDSKVTYRVVRTARFPYYWWGWREWMPESPEMEIASGITSTSVDGKFTIQFTAIPDVTIEKVFNPVFNYRVYADVTDLTGETHDAETMVSVGYNALLIHTGINETVNLDSAFIFPFSTTNLNGEKEPARGNITIWKLKEPDRILRDRSWNRPDKFIMTRQEFERDFPNDVFADENEISKWVKEKQVFSFDFVTPTDSLIKVTEATKWMPGHYYYQVQTRDAFGNTVETKGSFIMYARSRKDVPGKSLDWFTSLQNTAEPGDIVTMLAGSSARNVTAVYEVQQNNRIISQEILTFNNEQKVLQVPVTEELRGNFTVTVAFVKMNRSFQFSKTIVVPWTNRKLDIRFATFRSKLQPGQEEEWQITISGPKGEKVAAELLAGMYDASLDVFQPHTWNFDLSTYFNSVYSWDIHSAFGNRSNIISHYFRPDYPFKSREYDQLNWFGFNIQSPYLYRQMKDAKSLDMPMAVKVKGVANEMQEEIIDDIDLSDESGNKGAPPDQQTTEPKKVEQPLKVRTDFKETAFFFPQLATNENGEVILKFRIPESLTRWKMMGLAYTKDLKIGHTEKTLVTQKELMVFPNIPRFFREGDDMFFSVKVTNASDKEIQGSVSLNFFDALTMKPIDDLVQIMPAPFIFTSAAGTDKVMRWNIHIPEGLQAILYRVVATAGNFSDGEEAVVPVLTNRMLVTESMPLPVNGNQTRNFTFDKLIHSGKVSSTLRNYRLSLEFTSNPVWYAIQALPYLMEYPYECGEQLFSRFYANSIASHVANSNPKIKAVFESWKSLSPDALKSNLEKNQELKNVLLQESPWVREASNETERKQRVAILFDLNRMSSELNNALKKLRELQSPNGGFPWFQGMPDSRYITQHIVTGMGHLSHLGILSVKDQMIRPMLQSAINYMDARVTEDLERIKRVDKDYLVHNHLDYENIQYLYARSYFMSEFPLQKAGQEAFDYFRDQAKIYWKVQNNYQRGMIALALHRFSDVKTPALIMRSLSETALHNEEMGMYWRDENRGWFWYQAPIETQSLLIEAYHEILNDTKSVDELKIWLLKQKQTQDWKTTKATTEAVYALLLRGTDLLASDKPAIIKVGDETIDPRKIEGSSRPEAGTGYFKTSWNGSDIKPAMGKVTVANPNPTVAWGALYWQYFEQLDKITPAETPLKLSKKLFREVNTPAGPVIEPVSDKTPLHVGDRVVIRVELRSDRDMEYVHLKDMRASAFEPMNVLSGYRWQNGLGYYESTLDASSNFFISYLPKGTYVFEYKVFATQEGEFSNGITSVQCMYAPEFAAHSEGVRVKVE